MKSFIPSIVNLLSDPSAPVRDAAIQTLVEVYKHVGKFFAAYFGPLLNSCSIRCALCLFWIELNELIISIRWQTQSGFT